MAKQRLRASRTARQSGTGATSDALPSLGVNATPQETGGKRKGRRMAVSARETRVEAIPVDRLREIANEYPDASVTVVTRGKSRRYAAMVTYTDPSRVK